MPAPETVPAEQIAPPADMRPLRAMVLPSMSFDADDGLGFGGRLEVVRREDGVAPYRAAFVVHGYASLRGFHHHRVRFDLVDLGPRQDLRLTGHFAYRAWMNDGYWGVGNGTVRESAYEGDGDADAPERKRYRYTLVQPFGQLGLRKRVGGPLTVYATLNGRMSVLDTYAGSLLEEDAPNGMDGGFTAQLGAGALWDTRDVEVTPTRGWLLEAGGRGVGGAYAFGGPMASVRAWVPVGGRAVLGWRGMAEWLFGDVPFYEMVHWGGALPIAGVGGADTARGIPFGRWRAPGKALYNAELRWDVLAHRAAGEELRWQLVPFVDAVTVWGAGDAADAPPPEVPVHPAGGAGVHLVWAGTMVGRVDVGFGLDETDTGPTWNWGSYVVFDQMF